LRFQQTPPAIQDDLGHPGLGEFQATDIPNVDVSVRIDDPSRKLMQRIPASSHSPAMQALGMCLMTPALSLTNLLFQAPIVPPSAQTLGVTRDRRVLKPQIDAYFRITRYRTRIRHFYRQT
jgi:hypothetical protein